jgi:hypothetical protein
MNNFYKPLLNIKGHIIENKIIVFHLKALKSLQKIKMLTSAFVALHLMAFKG